MIIKPKTRGFFCTTSHPEGCAKNVEEAVAYAKARRRSTGPERVLVLGGSTGYGLASRVTAAFCYGAATIGVALEKPGSGNRTGTAGWYNTKAFDKCARDAGLVSESINGDAFSTEIKEKTIEKIKELMPGGQVDFVVYSLASPRRTDPVTGETYQSVIKPIGQAYENNTVDFHTGVVSHAVIEPASPEEISSTIAVMGGDDWLLWMQALSQAGVLAPKVGTVAYSYIGPVMTHPIYTKGTIGCAKDHLLQTTKEIDKLLAPLGGKSLVSVNKALVTQSSAAIPVVPLYIAMVYRIMKEKGIHEDCTAQMVRLFADRLYNEDGVDWSRTPVDENGMIRMDDWEMKPEVQDEILSLWDKISTENVEKLTDLAGYRQDFFKLFGFGIDGVDYDADVADY